MPQYNLPQDILDTIKDLKNRIEKLERVNVLENATVSSGGITVKDGGDITILDDNGNVIWAATNGPIQVEGQGRAETNFNVTKTVDTKVTRTFDIPPWARGALLYSTVFVSAANLSGNPSALYFTARPYYKTNVDASKRTGTNTFAYAPNGQRGLTATAQTQEFTWDPQAGDQGITSIEVGVDVWSDVADWGTDGFNTAQIHTMLLLLR